MGLYKNTRLKPNLTPNQINGFKSLLSKRDTISFSVSDKGGEFVVMNKDSQRQLTEYYLRSSTDVYRYIEPTRVNQGGICPVINPTVVSYKRQIKALTVKLQEKCNNLCKTICKRRNLDDFVSLYEFQYSTPCNVHTFKTHKFDVCQISNATDINQICKVRPIVSCVSSPTEKLAWLCTYILTPLLRFIPCHLNDIFQHLDNLSLLKPEQLAGKYFCSGDISSLYTNIKIQTCIDDIISLQDEHRSQLNLYGLKLIDIQEMLELVLGGAFFTYNSRVFLQTVGLFMGCKPSPICAIVPIYTFERKSIYLDTAYISTPYGKYIDDAYTIVSCEQEAIDLFNSISKQDPDGLLKWEIDFPKSPDEFTPFLGTSVNVDHEGNINYRYYRKTQKKNITLHAKSHHPLRTKVEVAKNFYKTAEKSSSSVDLAEQSKSLVDKLLLCNGYTDPRTFIKTHIPTPNMSYISMEEKVCLKIPYVSEFVSYEILRYIRKRKLPINVIFTPGNKLRDILCKLRPLDKLNCFQSNCKICELLEDNVKCTTSHPVYQITCKICREKYCGESSRTLHERLSEHLRYASQPNKAGYKEQALATHYRECHPGMPPSLSFKLLHTEPNTIMRKIHEALIISNIKPSMNDKNECIDIKRFLICC